MAGDTGTPIPSGPNPTINPLFHIEATVEVVATADPPGTLYPVRVWDYSSFWHTPHTFIETPIRTSGFKPKEKYHFRSLVWTVPGYVANDEGHPHDLNPTKLFYVDAATLLRLDREMDWDPGRYELNNGFWHNGAFNCTGWANRVLSNTGLGGNWSGVGANPYLN